MIYFTRHINYLDEWKWFHGPFYYSFFFLSLFLSFASFHFTFGNGICLADTRAGEKERESEKKKSSVQDSEMFWVWLLGKSLLNIKWNIQTSYYYSQRFNFVSFDACVYTYIYVLAPSPISITRFANTTILYMSSNVILNTLPM